MGSFPIANRIKSPVAAKAIRAESTHTGTMQETNTKIIFA